MSTLPDSMIDLIERTKTDKDFRRRVAERTARNKERASVLLGPRMRAYEHRHPDRISVRKAVMWAVKRGKLVRPNECVFSETQQCDGRIEAHHVNGYAWKNRFDIIWVCRMHHRMIENQSKIKTTLHKN